MTKKEGTMIIRINRHSLEEVKLKSDEVQKILKERFKMETINVSLTDRFDQNLYQLKFDTRDHALEASAWLNDILKISNS